MLFELYIKKRNQQSHKCCIDLSIDGISRIHSFSGRERLDMSFVLLSKYGKASSKQKKNHLNIYSWKEKAAHAISILLILYKDILQKVIIPFDSACDSLLFCIFLFELVLQHYQNKLSATNTLSSSDSYRSEFVTVNKISLLNFSLV